MPRVRVIDVLFVCRVRRVAVRAYVRCLPAAPRATQKSTVAYLSRGSGVPLLSQTKTVLLSREFDEP